MSQYLISRELERRKRANPLYSLRAYSKNLKLDSSVVSAICRGKRKVPKKSLDQVSLSLKLSPTEKTALENEVLSRENSLGELSSKSKPEYGVILEDDRHYKIIAEWEHYAVFTLMDVSDFSSKPSWIAKRLNISLKRAKEVIQNLLLAGLIEKKGSELKKAVFRMKTTEDLSSRALNHSHLEAMTLAKEKLETVSVQDRDYSSVNWALSSEDIPKVKGLLREFRSKLYAFCKSTPRNQVYQLNLQLFPLTDLETRNSK